MYWKRFSIFMSLFSAVYLFIWLGGGCGGPQSCRTSKECPEGWRCVKKICRLPCNEDLDCRSVGEKCINSYCGGTKAPDAGTTEKKVVPEAECKRGETRKCYNGPKGTEGVGICKMGEQRCTAEGKWGECEGEVTPQKEVCDQKDNDCDGTVDNDCSFDCTPGQTRPCYTGPPGTKGVGICKPGKETCIKPDKPGEKPYWGQCEGQVLPVPENCANQKDDNCNGKVNEGCSCKPGETRKCKAKNGCAGIQSCITSGGGTKWGECIASKPTPETCDGFDNDCDGKVDNVKGSDKPITRECTNVCFKGTETCLGGQWKNCTAEKPKTETCNNKDDDCDGKIDNIQGKDKPLVKGCDTGQKGICKLGQQFCTKGQWGKCIAPKPEKETCNDYDDDCDGKTDEPEDKPCGDKAKCIKDTLGVKKCVSN